MLAKVHFKLRIVLLVAAGSFLVGCQANRQALVAQPLTTPPGSMQTQQQRATIYDPFADNDAGPPVEGARPREFEKPLAEPVRAKNYSEQVRSRGFRDTRWPF